MKNKIPLLDERGQVNVPDWLFQEIQEDDFLIGKKPSDRQDVWDEEE